MAERTAKEIEEAIINDYNNGLGVKEICKKYNISDTTVYNIKKRYNVSSKFRYAPNHNNIIDDNTTNNIINDYNDRMMIIDICVKYNITNIALYKILRDNNITTKTTKLTKEQEQEIIKLYLDGYRIRDIAKKYHISEAKLQKILDTYNIPKRRDNSYKYKITDKKIINSIINDYINSNLLVTEICEKYSISNATLQGILRRNKVPNRKTRKENNYTDDNVINDYLNNIPTKNIYNKYNISASKFYRILKRNNIKPNRNKSK